MHPLYALLISLSFLFSLNAWSQTNTDYKSIPKSTILKIAISSIDGSILHYEESTPQIPWKSLSKDLRAIPSGDVDITITSENQTLHFSSSQAQLTTGNGLSFYFQGETPARHFISFPAISNGKIILRDPDTLDVIYETTGSTGFYSINGQMVGDWSIEPYVLNGYDGNFVLIDVVGGLSIQGRDYKARGADDSLYALVKKESLFRGSITVSLPTHIAYLSLENNKKNMIKSDYLDFYTSNTKMMVAAGLKYNFSGEDDALFLRPHGTPVGQFDYVFMPEEFSIKQYIENEHSLFTAPSSGLPTQKQIDDIYRWRFDALHGWGKTIQNSKSRTYSISTLGVQDVYSRVGVQGELSLMDVAVQSGGYARREPLIVSKDDAASFVIHHSITQEVTWTGCSKVEDDGIKSECWPLIDADGLVTASIAEKKQPSISNNTEDAPFQELSIGELSYLSLPEGEDIPENNLDMWEIVGNGKPYMPGEPVLISEGRYFIPSENQASHEIKIVDSMLEAACPGTSHYIKFLGQDISVCDKGSISFARTRMLHGAPSESIEIHEISFSSIMGSAQEATFEGRLFQFFKRGVNIKGYWKGGLKAEGSLASRIYVEIRAAYFINKNGTKSLVEINHLAVNTKKSSIDPDGIKKVSDQSGIASVGVEAVFGFDKPLPLNLTARLEAELSVLERVLNFNHINKECTKRTKSMLKIGAKFALEANVGFLGSKREIDLGDIVRVPLDSEYNNLPICNFFDVKIEPFLISGNKNNYLDGNWSSSSDDETPRIEYKITNNSNNRVRFGIYTGSHTTNKTAFRPVLEFFFVAPIYRDGEFPSPYGTGSVMPSLEQRTPITIQPGFHQSYMVQRRLPISNIHYLAPRIRTDEWILIKAVPDTPYGGNVMSIQKKYSLSGLFKHSKPLNIVGDQISKPQSGDHQAFFGHTVLTFPYDRLHYVNPKNVFADIHEEYNFFVVAKYVLKKESANGFIYEYIYKTYKFNGKSISIPSIANGGALISFGTHTLPIWVDIQPSEFSKISWYSRSSEYKL